MALDTKAKKIPLNRITHSLRASQLIYQYGPGNMVDFPDQTLMTAAPEFWAEEVEKIHDERLEKALHVDYFGMPSSDIEKNHKDGVSYVRFPEWYFCPKCRDFKPLKEWLSEYRKKARSNKLEKDPDMVRNFRCPTCWQPLVVSRIVTVCEHGHINDFPWVEWVHARSGRQICSHPMLQLKTASSSSEGLEGIVVACKNCQARTTLTGAFDTNAFERLHQKMQGNYDFYCEGGHPWKHKREKCGKFPRTMQRGSSSIYFPVTVTSLVIPPYSSLLTNQIEESSAYTECRLSIKTLRDMFELMGGTPPEVRHMMLLDRLSESAHKIAIEIGADEDAVLNTLKRRWLDDENEEPVTEISYRAEEYDALCGTIRVNDQKYDGDFVSEQANVLDYQLPFLKRISLIHKVREVIALTGFSRLTPVEGSVEKKENEYFVSIKESKTNWYPAYQVRGEGIFIEFNEDYIKHWRTNTPDAQARAAQLQENYNASFIGSRHPRNITSKYLLLHTISHLLIKQLSFECGYGIASLKERIYCGETADEKEMAGILIYTAGGDSEGTLGGLVRQGRSDVFPGIFRKAIEAARLCSNDPVCSLSNGQGRDSLNMAACHSCALLPETSCEDYNGFLDRGVVVGTLRHPQIGFFASQLSNGWQSSLDTFPQTEMPVENTERFHDKDKSIIVRPETSMNTEGMSWKDIWLGLAEYATDAEEKQRLEKLSYMAESFTGKEQPVQDCEFELLGDGEAFVAELLWPESRVMYFAAENVEGYEATKGTEWTCFSGADTELSHTGIIAALKAIPHR